MEDGSLIAWKDDGGDLSEILPDWFMKISVKFLSELSALLKREKFGALIKLSTRDNTDIFEQHVSLVHIFIPNAKFWLMESARSR